MRRWLAEPRGWLAGAIALGATGCASTSPKPAFDGVASAVEARSGHRVAWDAGTQEDAQVERAVRGLLARELSPDDAVQIALLRNPTLLATYEELSLAQADLVQAGLLKNPVFGVAGVPSEHDTLSPAVIGSVAVDFLDLLTLPARKTIAGAQLEAVKARVGDAVLELAARVRVAYFEVQAAGQSVAMHRTIADAAGASGELARRQRDAGNASELDAANQVALAEQAQLDLARAEGEVAATRERLTRLMGVWGGETRWRVPERLPELPAADGALEHLESLAMTQRLDVAAARREVEVLGRTLSFVRSTRFTGPLQAQVELDPMSDGRLALGPGIALAVPLFDQGQATVARVEATLRQSQHRLDAVALTARSEVRSARDRVVLARRVVERYRASLVPMRERIVTLSQEQYDAMLLGAYQLIAAKQGAVRAYGEYIDAVRDYWIARSDLERAVGGRLGMPTTRTP
jgi:cobalt-zinc-cadmium efflux system outer membrane protein